MIEEKTSRPTEGSFIKVGQPWRGFVVSERELVIQHIAECMVAAFTRGDVIDAQNMNAFLATLEQMTDGEYRTLVSEETSGVIS